MASVTINRRGALLQLALLLIVVCCKGQESNLPVVRFSLVEENSPHAVIGNIIDEAGVRDRYSAQDISRMTFNLVTSGDSRASSLFAINSTSGVLEAQVTIDRDKICPGHTDCTIPFRVTVAPGEFFQIIKVEVSITDLNDNEPIFSEERITRHLSESSRVNLTKVSLPSAVDVDSPQYSVEDYVITPAQETFKLQRILIGEGSPGDRVELILEQPLDREEQSEYRLTITARDKEGLSDSMQVYIIVDDINDHIPVFDESQYYRNVSENVPVETSIVQVHAVDKDGGDNGRVSYSFDSHTPESVMELFSLDSVTGVIRTAAPLDYESKRSYTLNVEARDGGVDGVPVSVPVKIDLRDENDHPPVITLHSVTSQGHFHVAEGSRIGSFVGHVTVEDEEQGRNGEFNCALSDDLFDLRPYQNMKTEFQVLTGRIFDHEVLAEYRMTLTCTDQGQPALSATEQVTVDIVDVNDNAPRFNQSIYHVTVEENNPPGSPLLHVAASDKDSGSNGQVRYSILSAGGDTNTARVGGQVFDIDLHTGLLSAVSRLDYESIHSLQLTVVAHDLGEPSKSSTSVVVIQITDVDDAVPEFHKQLYTFHVLEEAPRGTLVGNVTAVDPDTASLVPDRPSFMYSLDPRHNPGSFFTIDPMTGRIYTDSVLDREAQTQHELRVLAVNSNTTSIQVGSTQVLIEVTDVNDNPPAFEFPSATNDTVHVSSDMPVGHVFARLLASDRDQRSRLSYSFISGNNKGLFSVGRFTGQLSVAKPLSDVTEDSFRFVAMVMDGVHETSQTINVIVSRRTGQADSTKQSSNDRNLLIVIIIACVTAVLVVTLLVAIVTVLRRRHDNQYNSSLYKARLVEQNRYKETLPIGARGNDDVSIQAANQRRGSVNNDNKAAMQIRPDSSLSHCLYSLEGGSTYPNGSHGYNKKLPRHDDDVDSVISRDNSDSGRGSNDDVESPNKDQRSHNHGVSPQSVNPYHGMTSSGVYNDALPPNHYPHRPSSTNPSLNTPSSTPLPESLYSTPHKLNKKQTYIAPQPLTVTPHNGRTPSMRLSARALSTPQYNYPSTAIRSSHDKINASGDVTQPPPRPPMSRELWGDRSQVRDNKRGSVRWRQGDDQYCMSDA